jgi:hypothetical protein
MCLSGLLVTRARAWAVGVLSVLVPVPPCTDWQIEVSLALRGLVGQTAAHICNGSFGATGPVVVTLPVGPNLWQRISITAAFTSVLLAGKAYIIVPTTANPAGVCSVCLLCGVECEVCACCAVWCVWCAWCVLCGVCTLYVRA